MKYETNDGNGWVARTETKAEMPFVNNGKGAVLKSWLDDVLEIAENSLSDSVHKNISDVKLYAHAGCQFPKSSSQVPLIFQHY